MLVLAEGSNRASFCVSRRFLLFPPAIAIMIRLDGALIYLGQTFEDGFVNGFPEVVEHAEVSLYHLFVLRIGPRINVGYFFAFVFFALVC